MNNRTDTLKNCQSRFFTFCRPSFPLLPHSRGVLFSGPALAPRPTGVECFALLHRVQRSQFRQQGGGRPTCREPVAPRWDAASRARRPPWTRGPGCLRPRFRRPTCQGWLRNCSPGFAPRSGPNCRLRSPDGQARFMPCQWLSCSFDAAPHLP